MVEMMETNVSLRRHHTALSALRRRGTGMALAEAILITWLSAATVFHYHERLIYRLNYPSYAHSCGRHRAKGQVVFLQDLKPTTGLPQSLLVQSQKLAVELESNSQY